MFSILHLFDWLKIPSWVLKGILIVMGAWLIFDIVLGSLIVYAYGKDFESYFTYTLFPAGAFALLLIIVRLYQSLRKSQKKPIPEKDYFPGVYLLIAFFFPYLLTQPLKSTGLNITGLDLTNKLLSPMFLFAMPGVRKKERLSTNPNVSMGAIIENNPENSSEKSIQSA